MSLSKIVRAVRKHGHLGENGPWMLFCLLVVVGIGATLLYLGLTMPNGAIFILMALAAPGFVFCAGASWIYSALRKQREADVWHDYHRGREAFLASLDPSSTYLVEEALQDYDEMNKPFYT